MIISAGRRPPSRNPYRHGGFTLAELLISLVILGVIAAFTIPTVLQSQQTQKYNAMAKSVIHMIEGAYTSYQYDHQPSATTAGRDLTPYMRYVSVDTSTMIDDNPGDSSGLSCGHANVQCLRLQQGDTLMYWDTLYSFGGTASTNAFLFQYDPDSLNLNQSSADGPGKGIEIWLYYGGAVHTAQDLLPNSCNSGFCTSAAPGGNPSWFSWN